MLVLHDPDVPCDFAQWWRQSECTGCMFMAAQPLHPLVLTEGLCLGTESQAVSMDLSNQHRLLLGLY